MSQTNHNLQMSYSVPVIFIALISVIVINVVLNGQTIAADRLELDETSIVGSKELPKVLYIVPWKDMSVKGMANPTLDRSSYKGMAALDREVFQRELQYYGMLQGSGNLSQK